MALDPRISLGVQPLQIADPLAQYGKVAAIQQAQNQNALAQYQLSAAQRADEQAANRLRLLQNAGSNPTKVYNALLESGDIEGAAKFAKGEADVGKTRAETGDIRAKTIAKHMELSKERLAQVRTPEDYLAWHQSNHADPVLNDYFKPLGITAESQTQKILQQLQQPGGFENLFKQSALGLEKSMEQVLTSQNLQGVQRVLSTPKYAMPGTVPQATVVPGSVAEDQPLPAAVEAQKVRIASAGAPRTSVVNVQERAEAGEFGKLLVNQYKDISERAAVGARTKPALESNLSILDKGFDTGFGTETKAAGAKVLAALGVKDADKYATNAQTFLSNASQAVLQKQLEQKGPQTESDAARIQQIGAQLGNTKSANKAVLEIAKEQINRDIEQRKFYDDWKKKTGSFQGAEDAWFSGEGGKSLFDRPTLKKYVEQPKQPQGLSQDRRKGLGEIFGR